MPSSLSQPSLPLSEPSRPEASSSLPKPVKGLRSEELPKALKTLVGIYGECREVKAQLRRAELRQQSRTKLPSLDVVRERFERLREDIATSKHQLIMSTNHVLLQRRQSKREVEDAIAGLETNLLTIKTIDLPRWVSEAQHEYESMASRFLTEIDPAFYELLRHISQRCILFSTKNHYLRVHRMADLLIGSWNSILELATPFQPKLVAMRVDQWIKQLKNRREHSRAILRRFSDISGQIGRDVSDMEGLLRDCLTRLSSSFEKRNVSLYFKKVMFRITTALEDMIEGFRSISHQAHWARFYLRMHLRHQSGYFAPFRFELEYARLKLPMDQITARAETIQCLAVHHTLVFWKDRQHCHSDFPRLNGLIDASAALYDTARSMGGWAADLRFGFLSHQGCPSMRLRRHQAATLQPFYDSLGRGSFEDSTASDIRDSFPKTEETSRIIRGIDDMISKGLYDAREVTLALDSYMVLNWQLASYPGYCPFPMKSPSKPSSISPVTFVGPPKDLKQLRYNYDEYRGPDSERIPVFYCRDTLSLAAQLDHFQHNGVIAIDLRRNRSTPNLPGSFPPSYANDISIITLASESQIIIYHYALMSKIVKRLGTRVPPALHRLFLDPGIIKVGVDMDRLRTRLDWHLAMTTAGTCDIGSLHAMAHPHMSHRASGLQSMVQQEFNRALPVLPGEDPAWLIDLNLNRVKGKNPDASAPRKIDPLTFSDVANAASATLRLFFAFVQKMSNRGALSQIPLHASRKGTHDQLGILVPSHERNFKSLNPPADYVGPLIISALGSTRQSVGVKWAIDLADYKIREQPKLAPWRDALRSFYLFSTMKFDINEIETCLPAPRSNLPALIWEVVLAGDLPYSPRGRQTLLEMAWVQYYSQKKLNALNEAMTSSFLIEEGSAARQAKQDLVAALIGQMMKSRVWVLQKRRKGFLTARSTAKLLPFAMLHVGEISVADIGKLLILPVRSTARAIIHGALLHSKPGVLGAAVKQDPKMWQEVLATLTDAQRAKLLKQDRRVTSPGKPEASKAPRTTKKVKVTMRIRRVESSPKVHASNLSTGRRKDKPSRPIRRVMSSPRPDVSDRAASTKG